MNNINLFELLRDEGKLITIWLYPAKESVVDPYEKNKTLSFLNPISIKGLVQQLSQESLRWKFIGKIEEGSRQIICEKKYKNLFKIADKIKIGEDYFTTHKTDDKFFSILEREDYIIVILEIKNNG